MLRTGYRVPLDYIGPKPLIGLLSAAMVGGALLLAPEALNAAGARWKVTMAKTPKSR